MFLCALKEETYFRNQDLRSWFFTSKDGSFTTWFPTKLVCNKWSGNMNATFSDTWLVHGHNISFVIFFCVCICKLLPISSWFLKSKCQSQDKFLYWNWVLQKLYCNYLAVDGALFFTQSFASMHTMTIFGKLSQIMH